MKKILILGSTGNIGTRLVERFLNDTDCAITVFARHASSVYSDVDNIFVCDGDSNDASVLKRIIKNQDVIIDLVSTSILDTFYNIKELITEQQKLIYLAPIGIYGEIPNNFEYNKNFIEKDLMFYHKTVCDSLEKTNLNYTILRIGELIDGKEDRFVITNFGESVLGYRTVYSSLTKILIELSLNFELYNKKNIALTRDMTKEINPMKVITF